MNNLIKFTLIILNKNKDPIFEDKKNNITFLKELSKPF